MRTLRSHAYLWMANNILSSRLGPQLTMLPSRKHVKGAVLFKLELSSLPPPRRDSFQHTSAGFKGIRTIDKTGSRKLWGSDMPCTVEEKVAKQRAQKQDQSVPAG